MMPPGDGIRHLLVTTTCLGICCVGHADTAQLNASVNVTVTKVYANAAVVRWRERAHGGCAGGGEAAYELRVAPLLLAGGVVISERVAGACGKRTVTGLKPNTDYTVELVTSHSGGNSEGNSSDVSNDVHLRTLSADSPYYTVYTVAARTAARVVDAVILASVFVLWACAIALFLHRWRRIRVLQPREPLYRHQPKGGDSTCASAVDLARCSDTSPMLADCRLWRHESTPNMHWGCAGAGGGGGGDGDGSHVGSRRELDAPRDYRKASSASCYGRVSTQIDGDPE